MDEDYSQEYDPSSLGKDPFERQRSWIQGSSWFLPSLTVSAIVATAAVFFYSFEERRRNLDLESANQRLAAALTQLQGQIESMSERLSALQARTESPPSPHPSQRQTRAPAAARVSTVRPDPRLQKIQSQLSEQRKQIAGAREDIDKTKTDLRQTRDDLQSNISAAKNELSGSIARTHDDVVVLQRRGERNYYEFTIDKSKQYSRIGPMSVMLRKADTKHKRFDMTMQIDDNQLQKNGVNLYETVWISLSDRPQPLELVVNKIAKNHIEGYVSEPKYKRSELQSELSMNPAPNAQKPLGTQHIQ